MWGETPHAKIKPMIHQGFAARAIGSLQRADLSTHCHRCLNQRSVSIVLHDRHRREQCDQHSLSRWLCAPVEM
jgi:hypothetical protein